MDALVRQKSSRVLMDQMIDLRTKDHFDHTFAGIMFDIRVRQLPFEYIEVSSIWIRGNLGPITIWSTDGGFEGKHEDSSKWQRHYSNIHTPSMLELQEMHLNVPIRFSRGEKRGVYIHAAEIGDEQIVYDNRRGDNTYSDSFLDILPGMAHLANVPFSGENQEIFYGWWGPPWRERREFVGRVQYGIKWFRWNPEIHCTFPQIFREMVWVLLMSRHPRSRCSILYWLDHDQLLYVINCINWWENSQLLQQIADPTENKKLNKKFGEKCRAIYRWISRSLSS
uniref:Uncharacterized protein n=1 Tax=Hanusia phi TaxID=3032 RepID=A0A7S0EZF0_9CRYP|mmetsp:Transcript_34202/g.77001  ORF Transcript_34202/g.77001 Transcript_34202/m.77001 type:complete len:281 (+) Transcript_34202:150-992(+)